MLFETASLPFRDLQLGDNEVHLWLLDTALLPLPGIDDQTQVDTSKRFVRRFYLRLLLAAYLGRPAHLVKLAKTPSGKPYIGEWNGGSRPPLYFSLSHHAGKLLIAVCRWFPVGVDLESETRPLRQPMKLAKRYFHPAEYEYLHSLPKEKLHDHWLTIWTCKEAVVKATGGGIVSGLDRFVVLLGEDQPQLAAAINTPEDDPLQKLKLVNLQPQPGLQGALACDLSISTLRGWQLASTDQTG